MTQFGRALFEPNIETRCGNSCQAQNRVDRVNRALQGRLVEELRLACMEGSNSFQPALVRRYNERFPV